MRIYDREVLAFRTTEPGGKKGNDRSGGENNGISPKGGRFNAGGAAEGAVFTFFPVGGGPADRNKRKKWGAGGTSFWKWRTNHPAGFERHPQVSKTATGPGGGQIREQGGLLRTWCPNPYPAFTDCCYGGAVGRNSPQTYGGRTAHTPRLVHEWRPPKRRLGGHGGVR